MFGPTEEVGMAAYDKMFASNVRAPLFLVGALAPGLVERDRGSSISLSSMAGGVGLPGGAAYGATKASRIASRGHRVPRVRPRELHHRRDDRRRRRTSSGLDR
jgi:NADP-dependent 3-hydroxy acid dehydrogenase YdfG